MKVDLLLAQGYSVSSFLTVENRLRRRKCFTNWSRKGKVKEECLLKYLQLDIFSSSVRPQSVKVHNFRTFPNYRLWMEATTFNTFSRWLIKCSVPNCYWINTGNNWWSTGEEALEQLFHTDHRFTGLVKEDFNSFNFLIPLSFGGFCLTRSPQIHTITD